MRKTYREAERREFVRLEYAVPLDYKVCNKKTVSKLLQGYTANISPKGLLCSLSQKVDKNDVLWLSFDRATLGICRDLENRVFIYQNGVIGRVVRAESRGLGNYDVGIQFITREEKNLSHIFPRNYFVLKKVKETRWKNSV